MRAGIRSAAVAALLLLGGAACGGEVVGGGQTGEVETVATSGDGTGARASATPVPGAAATQAGPAGSVEFTAAVALLRAGSGGEEVLTGGATTRVALGGADSARVALRDVPAGTYDRVRVSFSRVTADVAGGLVIGGVSVTGTVNVALAPQPLVVERPLSVVVREGERRRVTIDLRGAAWLGATNPATRLVPAAAFRDAVAVGVR